MGAMAKAACAGASLADIDDDFVEPLRLRLREGSVPPLGSRSVSEDLSTPLLLERDIPGLPPRNATAPDLLCSQRHGASPVLSPAPLQRIRSVATPLRSRSSRDAHATKDEEQQSPGRKALSFLLGPLT